MEAEHRGRYWWAAQIAAERDVLDAACGTGYGLATLAEAGAKSVIGVDLDPEAVTAARRNCGDLGEVREGDVRDLPFADDSFDLAVCWETIEHVAEGERVIAEFRRVLRPEGILLVSSPNPEVYPPGNEHHVHEYRPQELASLVGKHFPNVATHRQHPWLASTVEDAEAGNGSNGHQPVAVRATHSLDPGGETYGIVVGGAGPLPEPERLVVLGGDFEVKWWRERVEAADRDARAAIERVEFDAQRLLAESTGREEELRTRLRDTAAALSEVNQELAQLPILRGQVERARTAVADVEAVYSQSLSWRLTAPLRRLTALVRPR